MLRFHLPLIEPDGRISRIRLSDGLHRQAHDHASRCNLRMTVKSLPGRSGSLVLLGRSQSQSLCPFRQRARSEAPLLHRHYPVSTLLRASPPPTRPGLALAGCPLRLPPLSSSVSRASCAFFRYMPSSLPRWNGKMRSSLIFPCHAGLPRMSGGSASTSKVSGPHRAFTCVTACIFAGSPSDPFHRRLRRIRCLLRRFDCCWASDPSQAGLPPARIHTHSRRTDITHLSPLPPLNISDVLALR